MRTGHFALAMLMACGMGATAGAQDSAQSTQTDSLAAASRRAQAQKKDEAKTAKVYTNDNLSKNGIVNVVGPASSAGNATAQPGTASASATPNAQPAATSAADQKKAAATTAALASAKEQLASAKKDLDVDQRKYALDQQSFLSNPNHASDTATAASLDNEQDAINAKKDEVEAAQKVVDDLQAQASASGAVADSSSGSSSSSGPTNTNSPGAGSTDTSTPNSSTYTTN